MPSSSSAYPSLAPLSSNAQVRPFVLNLLQRCPEQEASGRLPPSRRGKSKSLVSGEIGLLDHLWGRNPFSVRRGAEAAQRADRGDTHTQRFTQLRAARMRKTLLLLVWLIWVLALERKKLQ